MSKTPTAPIPDDETLRGLYPRLLVAAQRRLSGVETAAVDAEDLVQDAIGALLADQCPPDVPVEAFLRNHIRRSVSNFCRDEDAHAEKRAALDTWRPGFDVEREVEARELVAEVRRQLHALIADDPELAAVVDVLEDGITKPRAIANETELSDVAVRNARRRLATAIGHLPDELREAVDAFLRRAS